MKKEEGENVKHVQFSIIKEARNGSRKLKRTRGHEGKREEMAKASNALMLK